MKFPSYLFIIILGVLATITSCKSDDDSQIFRAYVEGKITTSNSEILLKPILLKSNNRTIAETVPKNSGSFVMAGPYETGDYDLIFNAKVKSFSTASVGCKISKDSTKISIPSGVTFISFDQITLE